MIEDKKLEIEKDYNPFEHRKVEKPNSDLRSLANLVKASLGSGLLAVPLAFANSGWLSGLIGTVLIALICGHCVHIFVTTSRACCVLEKKPLLGYAETCYSVFANGPKAIRPYAHMMRIIADLSMLCTYIGVCCIFTVLIADSVKQILDEYYPVIVLPVEYYCLIFMVPLCLLCQIRHLKWLAPFSLLANILLVATFAICLYYIFSGDLVFSDKQMFGSISRFPIFLSTVIFAMEGIGVVMPVENMMKKPQHFLGCPSVLVISMTIIMLLYASLGFFGYLRYGNVLRGSITLNLPIDEWPAICGKCFIAISIFCTYPLHFYVVIDSLNKYLQPYISEKYRPVFQIVLRTVCVFVCGGIAIALPLLEQIINIVGAFFYSILGLIIPGLLETIFRWNDLGKWNWVLWKNIVIMLIGIISLVSGCTVTVLDIITILNSKTV